MATCPSCGRDAGRQRAVPALRRRPQTPREDSHLRYPRHRRRRWSVWRSCCSSPRARRCPPSKISDITSTSNYAYVQINGVVSRGPNYNPDAQSITFWVRDDTGEIMVSAFRDQTQELIAADRVPAPGDTIALQGTLRVRDEIAVVDDRFGGRRQTDARHRGGRRPLDRIDHARR